VATNPNDWNASIIKEFRANEGKVGGFFAGKPVLLLHHTGAKSGTTRVNPLMYRKEGDNYVVFASKGGAPNNPDWFHNLKANPVSKVEVGTESVEVTARVADPEEREALYAKQAEEHPQFGEYERQTRRKIPVVVLEPKR
jgi:deazaflavin-dependent oxidoreductase (nitroreductase family)